MHRFATLALLAPGAAMTAFAFAASGCGDSRQTAASASGSADTPVQSLALEVGAGEFRAGDYWEYETRGGDPPVRWSIEVTDALDAGAFRARVRAPDGLSGGGPVERAIEYRGPWNAQSAQSLEYLRFPLRQGARWTSTAVGPGEMTRTLAQEVKGTQSLEVLGRSVECVRVDGTETTSMPGLPPIAVAARTTLWYCPTLRAVGRAETAVPGAPRVTQTLVAARSGG